MSASVRRANTWIGVLFSIGSIGFLIGPFPGYEQLVGSGADGITFFVGSIFFTSAALIQLLTMRMAGGTGADLWASGIQFVGTLFFNISTFDAMQDSLGTKATDRLVWQPDMRGSTCFLIAGFIAYRLAMSREGLPRRDDETARISMINLVGCIAFGVSAVASFVVPSTGDVLALGAANWTTSVGAACFLAGAILLLPRVSNRRRS